MPAFVAAHELHAVLVVFHQRAVGPLIADRHDLAVGHQLLDGAEPAAKANLRGVAEMLAGEDQHGIGEEGTLDVSPARVVEVGEIDADDRGAELCSSRSNREGHKSLSCGYGLKSLVILWLPNSQRKADSVPVGTTLPDTRRRSERASFPWPRPTGRATRSSRPGRPVRGFPACSTVTPGQFGRAPCHTFAPLPTGGGDGVIGPTPCRLQRVPVVRPCLRPDASRVLFMVLPAPHRRSL